MNKPTLVAIVSLVLAGSMAGISVYQQFTIVSINTRNDDLSLSVSQKTQENDILKADYNRLNSTYFQLLSNLQTITGLLNSSESELSSLQHDYSNLLESYDNLSSKVGILENSIAQLCQELGGYDGIFILNYTYVYTFTYLLEHKHFAEIELYNALDSANVTVKVYGTGGGSIGSTSKTFIYSISGYSKRTFVETWDTPSEVHFSLAMIEDVLRE